MIRQCAWCLRLIDSAGERVSLLPLPKLYEASHGMCGVCGTLLMEQAKQTPGTTGTQTLREQNESLVQPRRTTPVTASATVTQLVLELQQREPGTPTPRSKTRRTLPIR